VRRLSRRDHPWPGDAERPWLVYGQGRSYGDVCLNDGGGVLLGRGLDHFIAFDPTTGVLRAEAGVLLAEVLALVVAHGWFPAVTPGTALVTLGGAVANDVHGKNHHGAGSFGHQVRAFELVRSDGTRRLCSPEQSPEWFAATVGGLGLTGLITWVELQLTRIPGPAIQGETRAFAGVEDFFALSEAADQAYDYTVAWIDCIARGRKLGRGLLLSGRFAPPQAQPVPARKTHGWLQVPLTPPLSLINPLSLRLFNALYARKRQGPFISHYAPFFYPLDSIGQWNRIYGLRGFVQYQCVLPPAVARPALRELLERIARSGDGSVLAVLKRFGEHPPPGLLSFPRPGVTIALDFPLRGRRTLALLDDLDAVVSEAGGALYPAKDARMSPAMFARSFPNLEQFQPFIDPQLSSGFWRRVGAQ
jgi:FAD/FMN-containing dehydrogenase